MRVAGIVEVAARLLLAVVDAPVCWRGFRPSLGLAVAGCWVLVPVSVGLVSLGPSGFCAARLWSSPSESGAAFLHDGVLAPCPVGLSVLVRWQWWRRLAAQRKGPRGHRIWRRWRRRRRRPVRRRLLGFQRVCVAGHWSSLLVLGQLLPRRLQRSHNGLCHCPCTGASLHGGAQGWFTVRHSLSIGGRIALGNGRSWLRSNVLLP